MARFVFFTATGEKLDESQIDETRCYLGESTRYSVYLIYKPDIEYLKNTPLNRHLHWRSRRNQPRRVW